MSLSLIKSENFGNAQCDFYRNDQEQPCMTAEQLGLALGYSIPRESINKLVSRNEYLRQYDFSVEVKLTSTDGKQYETRVFSEDGIYEVTMLAKTEKAKEFRVWVRRVLKSLRKGEAILVRPQSEEAKLMIQKQRAEAMLLNARTRQAKLILDMQKNKNLSPVAVELLGINALEKIIDQPVMYRPEIQKTYTATEIANEIGISANALGKLANANGLKTDEFGITILDKSPYNSKQVPSFRYNDRGRTRLIELAKKRS